MQRLLNQHSRRGLWVLDENPAAGAAALPPVPGVEVLTNRWDVYERMTAAGWSARFSDFDFSPWQGAGVDRIYYRVSKEKPVVHHVINQARATLAEEGSLWLVGAKNEGTRTYFDKARQLFGDGVLHKEGKGLFSGCLVSPLAAGEPLDDRDYTRLRSIGEASWQFDSKPGLFGWDKIDAGSALLAEHLPQVYARLSGAAPRALDLGCGYGYLSAHVWKAGAGEVIATDNNAAAIEACRRNFERFAIGGEVVAANCAQGVRGAFDLVVCNPPFHQGFGVDSSLTDRFIDAAKRLLAPGGQALFVVNRFIPLERKSAALFGEVECLSDQDGFKVVRLARP